MSRTEQNIEQARAKELVPDDKFDRHMKMARMNDIESRTAIFCEQAEHCTGKEEERRALDPSIY